MNDVKTWIDVAEALDHLGRGARVRLADALGMDRSQLARMLRTTNFPKSNQAAVIDRFLAGTDAGGTVGERTPSPPSPSGIQRVPMYGYAAASEGDRFALNEGQILDWIDLPRGMRLQGEFFVVQTYGSSMEPRIWPGERKLVQRNVPPARDQDAVIEFKDGSGVLKTYKRERDGVVWVAQYNPEKELSYLGTDVKALHAVFPL